MNINDFGGTFVPRFTGLLPDLKAKREEEALKKEEEAKEKEKLQKEKAEQEKKAKQQEMEPLNQQLESAKEQADAIGDSFKDTSKCLLIAMRITRGDIVPQKDMKFLAEHEPDLFKQAIMLRQPKEDPEKCDSVLEDEENAENGSEYSSESGESTDSSADSTASAAVSVSAASAGGTAEISIS